MSQEQPRRPQMGQQEPIKYGDVFQVSGDLADEPVAPRDAAMVQSAEATAFGQTQIGGAAATMQSAADRNERAGLVGHRDITGPARGRGVAVAEADVPGRPVVTEAVAEQVVEHYVKVTPVVPQAIPRRDVRQSGITIEEALEATKQTAGTKPVDQGDAAAIQAAEVRATGGNVITLGGLAATAQATASYNAQTPRDEDKIRLADVVTHASVRLPVDKPATRQDAEGVMSAELHNNPKLATYSGGVADSVATASRLNERGT